MAGMNKRQFDPNLPLFSGRHHVLPDTEDKELTAYLTKLVDEIFSQDLHSPPCPYCAGHSATLRYKGRPPNGIPYFNCDACGRGFNRRTGTALQGFREKDKLPAFIRLLSQQRPAQDAASLLKVNHSMIMRWVRVFRGWLLELDPSGYWESKVRLGIKPPLPDLECPHCGNRTGFYRQGFIYSAETGKPSIRQYRCHSCTHFIRIRIHGT